MKYYGRKNGKLCLENPLNNNSIVTKLSYKNFSMLFTGDIEKITEEQLIEEYGNNLKSTILKVGHHGSNTSTTEKFLSNVRPKIALIGVGKNNKYGHPSNLVLERLKREGCRVLRTDELGEIKIEIGKKILKLKK